LKTVLRKTNEGEKMSIFRKILTIGRNVLKYFAGQKKIEEKIERQEARISLILEKQENLQKSVENMTCLLEETSYHLSESNLTNLKNTPEVLTEEYVLSPTNHTKNRFELN